MFYSKIIYLDQSRRGFSMYSWKRIRIVCAILLLLPIIHVVYLVSSSTMDTLAVSPEVWREEVEAFNARYPDNLRPHHPIVVVGGKRVTLWDDLPQTLAPREVLMRGVGDAIVEDIVYFYESLVGYNQPDTVVLLPSASEFHLRDTKSPEGFLEAVQSLVAKDKLLQVCRHRFYLFSPIKVPRRPNNHDTIDKATALMKEWATTQDKVVVLDANQLLTDPEGDPRPQYFRPDGSNLNEHGYLRLSLLLLAEIERDESAVELLELAP